MTNLAAIEPDYAKLSQKEWRSIIETTDKTYKTALKEPKRREIRKRIGNPNPVNMLQWAAFIVLFVLAIHTGFKTGALANPFSTSVMDHLSQSTFISDGVRTAFTFTTFVLFWLLSTPSLIYFKLLSHDPRLVKQRQETALTSDTWYNVFSLDYISPRLPSFITYFSTFWLFFIAWNGGGTIFEMFLPVLAEIGLAQLVGDVIEQNTAYARIINDRYKIDYDAYERRLHDKKDDDRVSILSGIMSETLMNLTRRGGRPNAFMEKADKEVTTGILKREYQRLTSVDNFIKELDGKVTLHVAEPVYSQDSQTLVPEITSLSTTSPRMTPPNGAQRWTKETLLHALAVIGANPKTYTEAHLKKQFAADYDALGLWRREVKEVFTGKRKTAKKK